MLKTNDLKTYGNKGENSGITKYWIHRWTVMVQFRNTPRKVYSYSVHTIGNELLKSMKTFARAGKGLNGFLNRNASRAGVPITVLD